MNNRKPIIERILKFFTKICSTDFDKEDECIIYDMKHSLSSRESGNNWLVVSQKYDTDDCFICLESVDEYIKYSLKCPTCGVIPNIHYECWNNWIKNNRNVVCCICCQKY